MFKSFNIKYQITIPVANYVIIIISELMSKILLKFHFFVILREIITPHCPIEKKKRNFRDGDRGV